MSYRGFIIGFAFGLAGCMSPYGPPELSVTPSPILQGDPIAIELSGVAPETPVRLSLHEVRMRREVPTYYTSTALFSADTAGRVDPAMNAPESGDYTGVDPAGLFWSRTRPDDKQPAADAAIEPLTLRVDIGDDGVDEFSQIIVIAPSHPDVTFRSLAPDFPGAVAARPRGEGPFPVMIVLGGSEGGNSTALRFAPRFAARGYYTIGLPYYSPAWGNQPQAVPGLPRAFANIPIDRLADVLDVARADPDADTSRIGIWGVSKGAEYALLAGSYIEDISAIAAIVPSDVVWEGWGAEETVSSFSWQGEPLPFVPYKDMDLEFQKDEPQLRIPHEKGRVAFPERVEPARIRVEDIAAPVFLVGGDADTVWASGPMARTIKATRDAAGLETELHVSETAGHYVSGDGYGPADPAEAKLRGVAWPAMEAFFARHLQPPDQTLDIDLAAQSPAEADQTR